MPRAEWRQHVLEALERREGRARRLRGLLERHEKLQDRLETLLQDTGAGTEHWLEVIELRRERQELHQQLAFVTETLGRTEAERREQHARMHRLAQDLGTLQYQYQELQCKAWELSREVEGLQGELDQVRGLLEKAQQERQELEARWVREKVLEAERLNWALEREEKYQRKVSHLREKLQRVRAEATQIGPTMAASEASSSASWEEPEMVRKKPVDSCAVLGRVTKKILICYSHGAGAGYLHKHVFPCTVGQESPQQHRCRSVKQGSFRESSLD